jgi:hypothetical protein
MAPDRGENLMPVEITNAHPPAYRLEVGDVVMVHRELTDKQTKKPFTWKFFGVVTKTVTRRVFACITLDEKKHEVTVFYDHPNTTVWYLTPDEWPDGVYAFRTKLILEGGLDMAI